jgi:hypothetical protein
MMMEHFYMDPNHSKALHHAPRRKEGERGGENIKKG